MSPKLKITSREGDRSIKEKSQVTDEKVTRKTVEVMDLNTGRPTIQTIELVQKVLETEVFSNMPILIIYTSFVSMQNLTVGNLLMLRSL